jgi:small GTP-binding protein
MSIESRGAGTGGGTAKGILKIVFAGDSNVGKTNLFTRLTDDSFNTDSRTTVGVDFRIKTISYEGQVHKIQLWDTAGQERYKNFNKSYFSQSKGIILVFDITSRKTFVSI